jgi:hypothetical protein
MSEHENPHHESPAEQEQDPNREFEKYEKLIPLDKSWVNRMGVLDLVYGHPNDIKKFLAGRTDLGSDLLALRDAAEAWDKSEEIDVGESGTLYRMLRFASWKLGIKKTFVTHGTLTKRVADMPNDPNIVNLSQTELQNLPDKTTQWASASVLMGDPERLPDADVKLKLSYEAVDHWKEQRAKGKTWEAKYDTTIENQAKAFLEMLKGHKPEFIPKQAEDYCFARVFGYMTAEEGEKLWEKLHHHESDRLDEMEKVIPRIEAGEEIEPSDHRVIQAAVMWGLVNNKEVKIKHPEAVNKSWPQFWEFIKEAKNLKTA